MWDATAEYNAISDAPHARLLAQRGLLHAATHQQHAQIRVARGEQRQRFDQKVESFISVEGAHKTYDCLPCQPEGLGQRCVRCATEAEGSGVHGVRNYGYP